MSLDLPCGPGPNHDLFQCRDEVAKRPLDYFGDLVVAGMTPGERYWWRSTEKASASGVDRR